MLNVLPAFLRELRLGLAAVRTRVGQSRLPYETVSLSLHLDLVDRRGERAVLSRHQVIRLLRPDGTLVRELVWGEGDQLVRYTVQGARRLGLRREGSKRTVLLDPACRPTRGDRLTITSRRTIRGGFPARDEYCEVFLERPTGHLALTVVFPPGRPPTAARLVLATTETLVRRLRPHYGADGRAVLTCRLKRPVIAATYSLRWRW